MGRRAAVLGLAAVALLAVTPSLAAAGVDDEIRVPEIGTRAGATSVFHVVVHPPEHFDRVGMEIVATIEGPGGEEEVVRHGQLLEGGDASLISLGWTPDRPGEHTLDAEVTVAGEVRDLEPVTVDVAPPSPASAGSGLPDTAPGTVQWAIAFGILFFVTRATVRR